ncbi:MAG: DUF362 domain-containing protein [Chitinivibrionales bacterium]|nr:DUF362 domain-containing protein [Chitinivibrionales bacterium]
MTSIVHFINLRANSKENILKKVQRLIKTAGIEQTVQPRDLVAVKLHFGELGNTAFIRPIYLRSIVELLHTLGAKPFLTDANTLYAGTRSDSPSHLTTAIRNGFDFSVVEAPLVIADGLRGKTESAVEIKGKHCTNAFIGTEIIEADSLISVAHFKGHELTGFGGTLKNIGMGCASRRGKMDQHSSVKPTISAQSCIGCGQCVEHCAVEAISVTNAKASIDPNRCVGCSECVLICPTSSIEVEWNQSVPVLQEKMMEYCQAVLKGKKGKALFINFITSVSPRCDCYGYSDAPLVRDIGVVAAVDPVAIDQASLDLVNAEAANPDSCLTSNKAPGEDKFKAVYPNADWEIQLRYAETIGLGSRDYELKKI